MAFGRSRTATDEVKPLTYWTWQRWSDTWHAGRDAKAARVALAAGPVRPELDPPSWESARTLFLGQLGRAWAEKIWNTYTIDVATNEIQLAQQQERRRAAQEKIRRLAEELQSSARPTTADLQVVRPGEESAQAGVLLGRRTRDFDKRRAALQSSLDAARADEEAAGAEVARIRRAIAQRRRTAEAQVAMIDSYVKRRRSAYLTRLVRKHPDGRHIPLPRDPGWSEVPSVGPAPEDGDEA
jgi:hypothetical protein